MYQLTHNPEDLTKFASDMFHAATHAAAWLEPYRMGEFVDIIIEVWEAEKNVISEVVDDVDIAKLLFCDAYRSALMIEYFARRTGGEPADMITYEICIFDLAMQVAKSIQSYGPRDFGAITSRAWEQLKGDLDESETAKDLFFCGFRRALMIEFLCRKMVGFPAGRC